MEEENQGAVPFPFLYRLLQSYIILLLGKEKGERTTLQGFLDRYHDSDPLQTEYELCDKEELVSDFDKAKEANDSTPTRVSNAFVSKKVYAKVRNITAGVSSYYFLEHNSYPTPVPGP